MRSFALIALHAVCVQIHAYLPEFLRRCPLTCSATLRLDTYDRMLGSMITSANLQGKSLDDTMLEKKRKDHRGVARVPIEQPNTLLWPEIDPLGSAFHKALQPALKQLAAGVGQLDAAALVGLTTLKRWLDAPCAATVKIDGTNLGVDNTGVVVGRYFVVEPGTCYHGIDVWKLLQGYGQMVEQLRLVLQNVTDVEVEQVTMYGELVVHDKHDYQKAGILHQWLCFGAVLRILAEKYEDYNKVIVQLRAGGYNVQETIQCTVLLSLNAKLAVILSNLGIRTVADGYQPTTGILGDQWAKHDGDGSLPWFKSLRQFLLSEWPRRFLMPQDGTVYGEGLVVVSEADGKLFKWNGGQNRGSMPLRT
eukprot:gnl/TRDRNA2_/TRDRNA2_154201_c0_seq2.p1 gnl/TRDRNA2_/TRDRNA2_154201_c0~~gnl/TRDRNA2_/TRDRNA2_154201_c0_seq2.p1  ORF type:complete len:363 (+),score=42.26 gnl/TRDRNA2_/TRDRNA2_154201_c0_seq2:105-1193(+)